MKRPSTSTEYPKSPAASMDSGFYFAGFKNLNSTPIPDEFFDLLAVNLSEAELRVLLYIMRRTFGFKKKADAISLSQLTGGIRRRDGSMLDYGTGLSKPAVLKAVSGLQSKGIISVEKRTGEDGRNEVNVYQLRFLEENNQQNNTISYPQGYSQTEYYGDEYNSSQSPDPRFPSACPGSSDNSITTETVVAKGGQMQTGETRRGKQQSFNKGKAAYNTANKNNYNHDGVISDNPPGKTTLPTRPVDNSPGKPHYPVDNHADKVVDKHVDKEPSLSLPDAFSGANMGQPGLPGSVNPVNQTGKSREVGMVSLINLQHGSLQDSRLQHSVEQQHLLLSTGTLALQPSLPEEPLEVEVDGDLLYINFRKLVTAMVELGLPQKLATELAYDYPEDYLWEKVNLTHQQARLDRHQRTIRNTAGYLRRAIEEDYKPREKTYQPRRAGSGQPARSFAATSTTTPVYSEDYHPADTAPLPPIYRPSGYSEAGRGATPVGWARAGYSPPPGESERASCGAVRAGGSYPAASYEEDSQLSEELETVLWEQIREDLAGRFRMDSLLKLLDGSRLRLIEQLNGERIALIVLATPWQERGLGMAARSAIGMALRQRLGPGYNLYFESG